MVYVVTKVRRAREKEDYYLAPEILVKNQRELDALVGFDSLTVIRIVNKSETKETFHISETPRNSVLIAHCGYELILSGDVSVDCRGCNPKYSSKVIARDDSTVFLWSDVQCEAYDRSAVYHAVGRHSLVDAMENGKTFFNDINVKILSKDVKYRQYKIEIQRV